MKQTLARALVEIDLGALQRNGAAVARRAGVPLLPMIKADAYGLGVKGAVRALEVLEPWGYGVATVIEGEELRDQGVSRPIVIFTPLLDADLARARAARVTPTLGFAREIEAWVRGGGGAWHWGGGMVAGGRRRVASGERHRDEPSGNPVARNRQDCATRRFGAARGRLHPFSFRRAERRDAGCAGEPLPRRDLPPAVSP